MKDLQILKAVKSITIFELVLTLVLSVAIGVSFWGWTFVYDIFKPFLKIAGLSYLAAGYWIFASIIVAYIVQKPSIAIIASLMAAFIQSLLTHWGPMSLLWGLVQGVGAELIFIIFSYRKWNLFVLVLASIMATVMSYLLDYFYYNYGDLSLAFNAIQLSSYIVSAIFLAGVLSFLTVKRLLKLGLLDQFKISKK